MSNPKGLIITIIIIAIPLIWFAIAVNSIEEKYSESGDINIAQTELENLVNEQMNNANTETEDTNTETNTSGETGGSRYGNPISKLIENARVNVDSAQVYQEPDENSTLVGAVYKDMLVTIQDYPNGWSNIKYGEGAGWIKSEYVTKPDETGSTGSNLTSAVGKKAKVIVDELRVREKAVDGNPIDMLHAGDEVNIIGSNEDETWFQIQYGTKSGWVSGNSKYIQVNY